MIPRKYKAKSNKFKFLKKKKKSIRNSSLSTTSILSRHESRLFSYKIHSQQRSNLATHTLMTKLRFALKKKKKKESSRNEELDTPSLSKMNSTRRNRRRVVNCYIGFFNGILLRVPRDRWNPLRELKFHAQQVEAPSSVEVYRQAFSRFAARIIDSRSIDLVTVHGRME